MTESVQIVRVKCPHCGYIRKIEIDVEGGEVYIVAGVEAKRGNLLESLAPYLEKIKQFGTDRELEAALAWWPMPDCPQCDRPYEFNYRTKETRK